MEGLESGSENWSLTSVCGLGLWVTWYVLAGHSVHWKAPGSGEKLPGGQGVQLWDLSVWRLGIAAGRAWCAALKSAD